MRFKVKKKFQNILNGGTFESIMHMIDMMAQYKYFGSI